MSTDARRPTGAVALVDNRARLIISASPVPTTVRVCRPFAVIGATCGVHSARPPAAPAQHPAATIKL